MNKFVYANEREGAAEPRVNDDYGETNWIKMLRWKFIVIVLSLADLQL